MFLLYRSLRRITRLGSPSTTNLASAWGSASAWFSSHPENHADALPHIGLIIPASPHEQKGLQEVASGHEGCLPSDGSPGFKEGMPAVKPTNRSLAGQSVLDQPSSDRFVGLTTGMPSLKPGDPSEGRQP